MSKERELGVLKGLEVEETTIKPREFFESNQTITSFARFKFRYFHSTKRIFGKCWSVGIKENTHLIYFCVLLDIETYCRSLHRQKNLTYYCYETEIDRRQSVYGEQALICWAQDPGTDWRSWAKTYLLTVRTMSDNAPWLVENEELLFWRRVHCNGGFCLKD